MAGGSVGGRGKVEVGRYVQTDISTKTVDWGEVEKPGKKIAVARKEVEVARKEEQVGREDVEVGRGDMEMAKTVIGRQGKCGG